MTQRISQPYVDFQSSDYWSIIAKYNKGNYIENYKRLKRVDYRALNIQRVTLSDHYKQSRVFEILTNIAHRSTLEPDAIFSDLHNLVNNTDLLFEAWGRIKNNKGAFTQGTNLTTADNINNTLIYKISEKIKTKTYKFAPVTRKYIPKPGKKEPRPLGIPNLEDRIVQQAIRMVLECIYEPVFERSNTNFGFRPGLGCHNAIAKIQAEGSGKVYAIEGDIKGAYDNVKFEKLIFILSKKIHDKNLLELIMNCLESGVMEDGVTHETTLGVPQGGIVSPLLFNIYMQEFDDYVNFEIQEIIKIKNQKENRKRKPAEKTWNTIRSRVYRERKALKQLLENRQYNELTEKEKEIAKNLTTKLRKSSIELVNTPYLDYRFRTINVSFTRYADDWILLTNADLDYTNEIKNSIAKWLKEYLFLELSEAKTKITQLTKRPSTPAKFLGFEIFIRNSRRISKYGTGLETSYNRTAGWNITIKPDYERILKRYSTDGFCTSSGKPTAKTAWTTLPDFEIVGRYNWKLSGIFNYYLPMISERRSITRIFYILYYSCLFTLARKHNQKITNFFKNKRCIIEFDARYETFFSNVSMNPDDLILYKQLKKHEQYGNYANWKAFQLKKRIELFQYLTLINNMQTIINRNYNKHKMGFNVPKFRKSDQAEKYLDINFVNWRTSYKLNSHCSICGATEDIQSHHIRHIKKGKVIGFAQILKQLNRRQITVCKNCHVKIHNGEYDGISLRDFYDLEQIIL